MRVAPFVMVLIALALALLPSMADPVHSMETSLFNELGGVKTSLMSLENEVNNNHVSEVQSFVDMSVDRHHHHHHHRRRHHARRRHRRRAHRRRHHHRRRAHRRRHHRRRRAHRRRHHRRRRAHRRRHHRRRRAHRRRHHRRRRAHRRRHRRKVRRHRRKHHKVKRHFRRAVRKVRHVAKKAKKHIHRIQRKLRKAIKHRKVLPKKVRRKLRKAIKKARKAFRKVHKKLVKKRKVHTLKKIHRAKKAFKHHKKRAIKRARLASINDKPSKASVDHYIRHYKHMVKKHIKNIERGLKFHVPKKRSGPAHFIGPNRYDYTSDGQELIYDAPKTKLLYEKKSPLFRGLIAKQLNLEADDNHTKQKELLDTFPWPLPNPNYLV